jgi:hypothetical protein
VNAVIRLIKETQASARILHDTRPLLWALGARPEPEDLLTLGCGASLGTAFLDGTSWKSIAHEYSEILPTLRADPRKHALALALLGDESVVEDLGRWLDERLEGPLDPTTIHPATALRLIGGKRALEHLYRAARHRRTMHDPSHVVVLEAIEHLEAPGNWKRLADLSLPTSDPHGFILRTAVRMMANRR